MFTAEREKEYYQAILDRNTNYEGIFYVGVKTTKVFCRPTCPTKKPQIEYCEFFATVQQARQATYQPCKHCRPDINALDHLPTTDKRQRSESILVDETATMARAQREAEQHGHRRLAKVHARDHHEELQQIAPEGELQNSILQHPELDNQRFDGIDPNLNPEPPLNTEARREFDNEKREQDKEKQLRLGNMPKFSSAPKPQGP